MKKLLLLCLFGVIGCTSHKENYEKQKQLEWERYEKNRAIQNESYTGGRITYDESGKFVKNELPTIDLEYRAEKYEPKTCNSDESDEYFYKGIKVENDIYKKSKTVTSKTLEFCDKNDDIEKLIISTTIKDGVRKTNLSFMVFYKGLWRVYSSMYDINGKEYPSYNEMKHVVDCDSVNCMLMNSKDYRIHDLESLKGKSFKIDATHPYEFTIPPAWLQAHIDAVK